MSENFYRAFEDKFRGSRELIKSRLRPYLPFIRPLLPIYPDGKSIDLGCGRGEWLELLVESGFSAHGVDLDDGMLAACRERGLSVAMQDAVSALKALPSESTSVVSGFHIAEHLQFQDLQILVREAFRVLRPAGLLILETPNPENLVVGTSGFHLDPSHVRPLPIALLSFLVEYAQFHRTKVVRLQESPELRTTLSVGILNVLNGVSLDYGVVAQKAAGIDLLMKFDSPFLSEYGLSQEDLCRRYDEFILAQIERLTEPKAEQAEQRAQEAISRAESAEQQLMAIYASKSWRITAPLRKAAIFFQKKRSAGQ